MMKLPPGRTRIKICGLTRPEDVDAAVAAGADAVGFVFAESSPRAIAPPIAADLVQRLPAFVVPIGVFVDLPWNRVRDIARTAGLSTVQLHGTAEDEAAVEALAHDFKVIRAIPSRPEEIERWGQASPDLPLAGLLVDGSSGGLGQAFDWQRAAELLATVHVPLIVAGGLDPDNVGLAIRLLRPFGVDVSSGVEETPGVKSVERMSRFCAAVRAADDGLRRVHRDQQGHAD